MIDVDSEFDKLDKKAHKDEEKYLNAQVTVESYNFPHIYLTLDEIDEFNKECDRCGIDLKVVSLEEYMNLNTGDKSYNISEEESMEVREMKVDKVMNHLAKNYMPKEEEKNETNLMNSVNNYIRKKQRRIIDDNSEIESDKSNKSLSVNNSFISKSFVSKKTEKSDKNINNNENIIKNKNKKKKGNDEHKKDTDDELALDEHKKKVIKKKKPTKAGDILTENFDNYFRRIKETRKKQVEDEERRVPLIKEILEKSQNLTKEELKDFANHNGISLVNDITLSEYDLSKKDTNQLDRILVDININSDVLKLNQDRPENIKRMKSRLEREKKFNENHLKNKKLKEEKKMEMINASKKQSSNINENKDDKIENKKQDKKDSDLSDSDSGLDEDSI